MTPEPLVAAAADVLDVTTLNRAVAGLLGRGFPLVRVRGEIGNLTRAASGHWYFTLKDDAAQVRCVMFRGRNALVGFAPREAISGDFLEGLTRELLRPMLAEWLEANLPTMVESLVQAEIARIVGKRR